MFKKLKTSILKIIYFVCMVLYTSCISVYHLYTWCPGTQVRALEVFKLKLQTVVNYCGCRELNLSPMEEKSVLQTTESSLLLQQSTFKVSNSKWFHSDRDSPQPKFPLTAPENAVRIKLSKGGKGSSLSLSKSFKSLVLPSTTFGEQHVSLWSVRIKWNKTWKWSTTQPLLKGSKEIG